MFGLVLVVGLCGLAVAAVGIAHQLLPRQFTAVQRRAIETWEVHSRWRALAAGAIFPASVSYHLPAIALNGTSLELQAGRLGISPTDACASALTGTAGRVLHRDGCSAAMRATYVDASGGLVATVAVAVLPTPAAALAALKSLAGRAAVVRPLAVPGTPAAGFGDRQRQLSAATAYGPYLVMSTAGFSDGRRKVHIGADPYLDAELKGLMTDLNGTTGKRLGSKPPTPVCPGAPGC